MTVQEQRDALLGDITDPMRFDALPPDRHGDLAERLDTLIAAVRAEADPIVRALDKVRSLAWAQEPGWVDHLLTTCDQVLFEWSAWRDAPDTDRLRALVEAIDHCHKTGHLRHSDAPRHQAPTECYCSVNDALDAARALLAGEDAG